MLGASLVVFALNVLYLFATDIFSKCKRFENCLPQIGLQWSAQVKRFLDLTSYLYLKK